MTTPVPHPFWMNTAVRHIDRATPSRPDHSLWPAIRLLIAVGAFGVMVGFMLFRVAP